MATPAQKRLVQKRLADIREANNARFKWPKWTGFTDKTLWDVMQLLIVPLILLGVTIGFGWWQAQLADTQHLDDIQLANDQQQETTLKTYLDDMSDLLLNHNLSNSKPGVEVREVARERTLTALRRLKADRNKIVLQFLRDAHLIGVRNAVVSLGHADLSGDDLSGANLSGTDLSGTDLSKATIQDANLSGTILNGADLSKATIQDANLSDAFLNSATLDSATLSGANLSGATLSSAILNGAILNGAILNGAILNGATLNGATLDSAILSGANLSGATLSDATLDSAILSGADLSNANVIYAHLSGADLSDATLDSAILSGADLSNANMIFAHLSGADLSYAHLNGARNLTQHQLDEVYSCTNAILSTGLTCNHNPSKQ